MSFNTTKIANIAKMVKINNAAKLTKITDIDNIDSQLKGMSVVKILASSAILYKCIKCFWKI